MRIVNTTCVYDMNKIDILEILDRLSKAGFKDIDLALGYLDMKDHILLTDRWVDWVRNVKDYADEKGIHFVQCHGVGWPAALYANPDHIGYRAIEIGALLGVKWIVMHPQELQGTQGEEYNDFFVDQNRQWFTPYLKRCEEKGIGVAIENLPWPNANRAKPLADLVDALDSPYVGICWDTGHAHINGLPPEEMKVLGDRLVTLHIHDNHGWPHDEHQIPFYGTYDWADFICTLREMNYKGDFVLEAHHQMRETEDETLREKYLAEMMCVSQKILQMT